VVAQKSNSGKGRNGEGGIKYGFSLIKGKSNHSMEDYHVAKFTNFNGNELGLFAIFDGHKGDHVAAYLQKHLFSNILKDVSFIKDCCFFVCVLCMFSMCDDSLMFTSRESSWLILEEQLRKLMRIQIKRF
jgi:hypothetical protein